MIIVARQDEEVLCLQTKVAWNTKNPEWPPLNCKYKAYYYEKLTEVIVWNNKMFPAVGVSKSADSVKQLHLVTSAYGSD